jgi:hypothetical protein
MIGFRAFTMKEQEVIPKLFGYFAENYTVVYLLINSRVTDMELYSSKYELISHSLYF